MITTTDQPVTRTPLYAMTTEQLLFYVADDLASFEKRTLAEKILEDRIAECEAIVASCVEQIEAYGHK